MIRTTLLILAVFVTQPADAQVYKCTVNGRTAFTDKPCDDNAQPLKVRPAAGHSSPQAQVPTAPVAAPPSPAAPTANTASEREAYAAEASKAAKKRAINDQIHRKKNRLIALRQARDREIAALQSDQRRANNNLAGAAWLQSISQELQAINGKYDTEMRMVQTDIDQLVQDRAALD